jgi:hypothetical protein
LGIRQPIVEAVEDFGIVGIQEFYASGMWLEEGLMENMALREYSRQRDGLRRSRLAAFSRQGFQFEGGS